MAAALTADEEKLVQHFLVEVNRGRSVVQLEPEKWTTGVKFLMARKFDMRRALELYKSHQKTREQDDLLVIDPLDEVLQAELATEKFTVLRGRDMNGACVALFTARYHYPLKTSHQTVLKALIHQLDAALESLETQRHGLVFIYDMSDSKYNNFEYILSEKILTLLKGGYPARLKKVLIVTAPLWFKAPFKILRLFVKQKLRDRVYIITHGQLPLHIPRESLPRRLGGLQPSGHKQWLQLCHAAANSQTADLDSYFISRGRLPTRFDSQTSYSSDTDNNVTCSDMDSEESKETVSEKHNSEDREKEAQELSENEQEKEVAVEKNGTRGQRIESRSHHDNRKRPSESDGFPDQHPPAPLPRKKRPTSADCNIWEDSIHNDEQEGMGLQQLVDHVLKLGKRGLIQEYGAIRMESPAGTFNTSKLKYNLPKNRYTDVLCFDHSRVALGCADGDTISDYINANYVDGYKHKNAYISSQGPLPKTFIDFWRMIWEQNTLVIIMTTRAIERSRIKCGQYWPRADGSDEQFGEFVVYNVSVEQYADYTVTSLLLCNTKMNETRALTHLQFTSWPDYGIPPASPFLDFLFHVRSCQAEAVKQLDTSWIGHPLGPPMVVHCSAGIGRTGTFITIDICLRRLEDIATVDIRETVRRIRSQRAYSIQMPEQYVFCHLGVIEYAQRNGVLQDMDWAGFDDSDSESD